MATRKDVAKKAGVSVATVSNVINKNKYVSDELIVRVKEAINYFDYQPNIIARSLSTKKTYHVGIIVNNVTNSYYGEIALGMSKVASVYGYTVSIYFTLDDSDKHVTSVIQRQLDGLFIATNGDFFTNSQIKTMLDKNIVFVNSVMPGAGSTVTFDYFNAVDKMIKYLADNNHRHIGFLCGMPKNMLNFIRYKAFVKSLQKYDLPVLDNCIIESEEPYGTTPNDGYIAMKKLLNTCNNVTAVFCLNDLMALGAMKAIREAGLKIPQDISVVGCDDVFFTSCIDPALTTLSVQKEEMGKEAMIQLLNQMNKGTKEDVLLDVDFVIRDSTGPAPSN